MGSTARTVGSIGAFVGLAAAFTGTILVVSSDEDASAAELERFASCEELQAWTAEVTQTQSEVVVGEGDSAGRTVAGAPTAAGPAPDAATESGLAADNVGGTGGTNTVVAGVDEIDIVDRVGEDRLVVARNGVLSLVDLDSRAVLDTVEGLPWDARVSVDESLVWAAGTVPDGTGTEVLRLRIDGDAVVTEAEWTTPGFLLDARRTGDRLHVVTVDQPFDGRVPFEDGPVPCDQVWRPVDPATTPAATLIASLPATGDLTPVAAAEVTGAGGNLLVTATSAYVATETWADDPSGGQVTTGLHRFDLDTLVPTGSGAVPGSLAGPFALDEHEGHLRVATSLSSFGPVILEDVAVDVAVDAPVPGDALPPEPSPVPEPPTALAEVFVLDAGSLDLVGRSGLFGHDGETIQGVRFVGEVAYVVTFLNTDPFWVLDLRDPSAPDVVGELAIPGFSAYLHPAGEGRVVGFGPDGQGQVAARLFDVSDPTSPTLIDEVPLGDDSPIVWDHHAYVAVDDTRFAVPVTDWPDVVDERCGVVPEPLPTEPVPLPVEPDAGAGGGSIGSTGIAVDPAQPVPVCEPVFSGGSTGATVLAVDGDRFAEQERAEVESDGSFTAERIVLAPDGTWLLVGYDRIVPTDGGDPIVLPADPTLGGPIPTD